jgi:hypothetical protein
MCLAFASAGGRDFRGVANNVFVSALIGATFFNLLNNFQDALETTLFEGFT